VFNIGIVIAKHSPERILERELPIESPEKNHGKDNDAAQQAIFSGPVCLPNIAKPGLFRIFHRQPSRVSLQVKRMLRDHVNSISENHWEQKSSRLSRCLRTVIAKHSPERVLERGLPMKAPEKNPQ
jgi:hypothetical protein